MKQNLYLIIFATLSIGIFPPDNTFHIISKEDVRALELLRKSKNHL